MTLKSCSTGHKVLFIILMLAVCETKTLKPHIILIKMVSGFFFMGNVNLVCIQAHWISGFSPVWFLTVLCSWT